MFYRYFVLVSLLVFINPLMAKNPNPQKNSFILQKTSALDPPRTLSNIGNISYWLYNDGKSGLDPDGNAGAIYPRGTTNVIYQDGLVWGAKINGIIKVGGQTYRIGTQALLDRIYRIRRDWATLTPSVVLQDAAEFYGVDKSLVTNDQANAIISQYKKDWQEWPADKGAPYVDVDLNGAYNPLLDNNGMPDASRGDYPGIKDADQVVWFVANDQDAGKTTTLYGSEPMGIEMQVTVWAYDQPNAQQGQAVYKKYKIKNTSLNTFTDMYLSQWSDPDIGNYTDDLVGCDVLRNTAYAYNGTPHDAGYDQYQLPPVAFGYTLLQGPMIPSIGDTAFYDSQRIADYKNLNMSSFGYFSAGSSEWGDPEMGAYDGTLEWYNLMRGFIPTTNVDAPAPFTHRGTGEATKFPLDGDPVAGTGDIDGHGLNDAPSDRRMTLSSGPFTMNPGDEQEMVVALVGGQGQTNISAISALKSNIDYLRENYGIPLKIPVLSHTLETFNSNGFKLFVKADLRNYGSANSCQVTLDSPIDTNPTETLTLYDDGVHEDANAGDNIWGNTWGTHNRKYPHSGDLVIYSNSDTTTYPGFLSDIRLRPLPIFENWKVIWENGPQDGKLNLGETAHLQFDIHSEDTYQKIDTLRVKRKRLFTFNNGLTFGQTIANDSLYFVVTAPDAGDSLTIWFDVYMDHHSERVSAKIPVSPVEPTSGWQDTLAVTSIKGTTEHAILLAADPSQFTGHTYSIAFFKDTVINKLFWRLKDETLDQIKLDKVELSNDPFFAFPIVDGIQFQVKNVIGGIDANDPWGYQGNRWVSATSWGGAYFFGGLDLGTNFFGSNIDNPADYTDVKLYWAADTIDDPYSTSEADLIAASKTQLPDRWSKGQTYRRDLGYAVGGAGDIPFAAYDMRQDPPRRLNVCFVEDANEGTANLVWDMGWNNGVFAYHGGREYLFIMNSNYDEGIEYDDLNFGPSSDVLYALWPAERGSRPYLLDDFTMWINATTPNVDGDSLVVYGPVAIDGADKNIPTSFYIKQNYPNPFNPVTHIRFGLAHKSKIKLEVYNLLGQKVRTLINKDMASGKYNMVWNGRNDAGNVLSSGVYIYKLDTGEFSQARKMIFLK